MPESYCLLPLLYLPSTFHPAPIPLAVNPKAKAQVEEEDKRQSFTVLLPLKHQMQLGKRIKRGFNNEIKCAKMCGSLSILSTDSNPIKMCEIIWTRLDYRKHIFKNPRKIHQIPLKRLALLTVIKQASLYQVVLSVCFISCLL